MRIETFNSLQIASTFKNDILNARKVPKPLASVSPHVNNYVAAEVSGFNRFQLAGVFDY
jgi:hypothetical protein